MDQQPQAGAGSGSDTATRAYLAALFAVVVWGASFIATKIGLHQVSPLTVIWLRFGIGVGVLAVAVPLRKEFFLPRSSDLVFFVALGALGITLHQWLQVTGLVTALASTTAWIVAAIPLVIALISRIVLDEPLRRNHLVGIVVGAVGVLLVVSQGNWSSLFRGGVRQSWRRPCCTEHDHLGALLRLFQKRATQTSCSADDVVRYGERLVSQHHPVGLDARPRRNCPSRCGRMGCHSVPGCILLRSGVHFLVRRAQSPSRHTGGKSSLSRATDHDVRSRFDSGRARDGRCPGGRRRDPSRCEDCDLAAASGRPCTTAKTLGTT